ncbi:hypothetical protein [Thiomonas sp.]|uniref:hypothetical protein n=1 Tax=Thiomonas sp. TaxID=2047785 RepID=UPI00260A3BDD|nr:hypothetical protein [Thiomonas sp.]
METDKMSRLRIALALATACATAAQAKAHVVEFHWHVFSRSCAIGAGAQESITYAFAYKRWSNVISEHYQIDDEGTRSWLHNVVTPTDGPKGPGWHFGRRGRAGHFGEFWYGHVTGHHWGLKQYTGQKYLLWNSDATDCNLNEW